MQDVLLKSLFSIGLFLIIFHSIIFHFVREKPTQKLNHANHVVKQQVKQPKKLINRPLPPKVKINNKKSVISKVVSNKSRVYKNNKKEAQILSKKRNVQEISDQYIETILNKQKRFFKTCYIRHLKNNFASKGSILLSFNINSPGRVSDVSIQGGSIEDERLHNCMKKVVERVTFTHFSGPLTKVFYPIEFN